MFSDSLVVAFNASSWANWTRLGDWWGRTNNLALSECKHFAKFVSWRLSHYTSVREDHRRDRWSFSWGWNQFFDQNRGAVHWGSRGTLRGWRIWARASHNWRRTKGGSEVRVYFNFRRSRHWQKRAYHRTQVIRDTERAHLGVIDSCLGDWRD